MPDPRAKFPDWNVVRGDPFQHTQVFLRLQDDGTTQYEDMSVWGTWSAQLRYAEDGVTAIAFSVALGSPTDSDVPAVLTFSLTAAQTAAMALDTYLFDVQATGGDTSPDTPFSGRLNVTKDVTR